MNPPTAILPQPILLGLRAQGRGAYRDPQPQREALPLQEMPTHTFSQTKGTALYRLHKPQELVFVVLTLLAYGSSIQAIVAAFGLDERTVSLAGKKKPVLSVGECTSTWWKPATWSFRRFKPTNSGYGWWAGLCGWQRLWRSGAGCGWAAS
jgi:hypothetical protein